jgi:hypothetical protein
MSHPGTQTSCPQLGRVQTTRRKCDDIVFVFALLAALMYLAKSAPVCVMLSMVCHQVNRRLYLAPHSLIHNGLILDAIIENEKDEQFSMILQIFQ